MQPKRAGTPGGTRWFGTGFPNTPRTGDPWGMLCSGTSSMPLLPNTQLSLLPLRSMRHGDDLHPAPMDRIQDHVQADDQFPAPAPLRLAPQIWIGLQQIHGLHDAVDDVPGDLRGVFSRNVSLNLAKGPGGPGRRLF